ncbi:MAG: DNA damage-inducible protein D [Candidatus Methanoperedens sp.]|jgi:DNA-damage-inducible protein D|nr:DNA damage-inducible protein D [Candidatus Methanoperedens sp.]PKL53319.1 MAG: DNA damage-inducible protein D [Candidatus Methanoperedenaceae archaeon HGW-Methanoperedenaceae-1]
MPDIEKYSQSDFEKAKQHTQDGVEFWYARDLKDILEYEQWRNFLQVVEKAKESCKNAKNDIGEHFADVSKLIVAGKGAKREIDDIMLSRYACYLIVQNADPRKKIIALGQTYFAVKTRERENDEAFIEDQKRFAIRNELKNHNKSLAEAANMSGIDSPKDYAIFQNKGYQGLYNGLGVKDIHKRKGLDKNQKILDHMGSTELAANLFRATQTDDKLRRENIRGKENANKTHFVVGKKVRQTIKELGGTMPEYLELPEKSIKEIEEKPKKRLLQGEIE